MEKGIDYQKHRTWCFNDIITEASDGAKIRYRYNQVPHHTNPSFVFFDMHTKTMRQILTRNFTFRVHDSLLKGEHCNYNPTIQQPRS